MTGWSQWTMTDKARRVSSATAYLFPAMDRPNLDVLVNTQVTKLLQTGTSRGKPIIKGVEFALNAGGECLSCVTVGVGEAYAQVSSSAFQCNSTK